ncbi:RmlC-like cupin domain-containing protein [Podospora australis]|uniref:RmlC-like cupin domain-containing protein n=1 Tax=Podospora australis TaxID=1536484 RepID=A0AAN6WSX1_9PEZI|nr:RmlC-like cupin domain-containing protein [Podospora australis]
MASLLPLVQDILPMILPASISITKAADILPPATENSASGENVSRVRVISRNAVVDKTDKMCASVLLIKPNSSSPIHHHGEQETILYVSSGKGVLLGPPKDDDEVAQAERRALEQGDFAFVPAWTEHQALNESNEQDLLLVVIRSGGSPVDVNLTTWGGREAKP